MNESKNVFQAGEPFTPELEAATVRQGQPHVVILGSGASRAACLNGDKNGRILPTFENLTDVVGLKPILEKHSIEQKHKDACMMTIFGYGTPATDVEAVDLMQRKNYETHNT